MTNFCDVDLFEVDILFLEYVEILTYLNFGDKSNANRIFSTIGPDSNLAECSLFTNWWSTLHIYIYIYIYIFCCFSLLHRLHIFPIGLCKQVGVTRTTPPF